MQRKWWGSPKTFKGGTILPKSSKVKGPIGATLAANTEPGTSAQRNVGSVHFHGFIHLRGFLFITSKSLICPPRMLRSHTNPLRPCLEVPALSPGNVEVPLYHFKDSVRRSSINFLSRNRTPFPPSPKFSRKEVSQPPPPTPQGFSVPEQRKIIVLAFPVGSLEGV